MKKLLNLLEQDFTGITRDSVIIYIVAAPLLLAVLGVFLLPGVENSVPSWAVSSSLPREVIRELGRYGRLILLEDEAQVKARVLKPDEVPGVVLTRGQVTLLLEGNESSGSRVLFSAVLQKALEPGFSGSFEPHSLGKERSFLREYVVLFLLLLSALLGGMTTGFSIVEEKESRTYLAKGISPLGMGEYVLGKGIFAFFQGVMVIVGVLLILIPGGSRWQWLLPAVLFATPQALILALYIGLTAGNQISAVGASKLIMPLFLTVPFVGIVLPESWQWVLYPFPSYWMYLTFKGLIFPLPPGESWSFFWFPGLMTLVSGLIITGLFYGPLKRKLRFR